MRILNLLRKQSQLAVLASVLVLGLASSAAAFFILYPPGTTIVGVANKNVGPSFWKFALPTAPENSPLLDTTGAKCNVGQSGPLFFLAGTIDNTPVVRNCSVPIGKSIVIPVINALSGAFPDDPANQRTEAYQRSVVDIVKKAKNLKVVIDGTSLSQTTIKSYLVDSNVFSYTFQANNLYGVDAGTKLFPAVDKGIYLGLAPLVPGTHTIYFHAEIDAADNDGQPYFIDVKYNIYQKFTP